PALRRPAGKTVLDPVADKAFRSTVVHFNRYTDHHGSLWLAEPLENAAVQLDLLGGHFQLPAGHLEGRRVLEDRNRLVRPIVVGVKNDPVLMSGSRDGLRWDPPAGFWFVCRSWPVVSWHKHESLVG